MFSLKKKIELFKKIIFSLHESYLMLVEYSSHLNKYFVEVWISHQNLIYDFLEKKNNQYEI
jgi:hypothetical protein